MSTRQKFIKLFIKKFAKVQHWYSSESWCVLSRFQIGYPAPDLTLDYCNFPLTVAELSWFPPRKNVRTPISTPTRTFLRGATQLNSAQVREKCSIRNATRRILSHFRSKKCEKSKKISIRSQKSSQSWIADLKKQQNTPTFAGLFIFFCIRPSTFMQRKFGFCQNQNFAAQAKLCLKRLLQKNGAQAKFCGV